MKKVFFGIFIILIIIMSCFLVWYNKNMQELKKIKEFNNKFEYFLNKDINGIDLNSIINLAIENNEKYEVEKDKNGVYKNNNKNSIEIEVRPAKDGKTYKMEAFIKIGMSEFRKSFGSAKFKSTTVKYHKNKRISKIVFEIQNN